MGEVFTTHEGIDAISFTGSNPVGRSTRLKATQQEFIPQGDPIAGLKQAFDLCNVSL